MSSVDRHEPQPLPARQLGPSAGSTRVIGRPRMRSDAPQYRVTCCIAETGCIDLWGKAPAPRSLSFRAVNQLAKSP